MAAVGRHPEEHPRWRRDVPPARRTSRWAPLSVERKCAAGGVGDSRGVTLLRSPAQTSSTDDVRQLLALQALRGGRSRGFRWERLTLSNAPISRFAQRGRAQLRVAPTEI